MKVRRHYLTLRRLYPQIREDEPMEITLDELAAALDCTHRNMVLLLRRMEEESWLTWTPRRGRGNRSLLRFLARREDMTLEEAYEQAGKQNLHAALELIHAPGISTAIHERFHEWLTSKFGYRSEMLGHQRTDILRFPLPQTIHSLDPAAIHYVGESHLVNQLFDSLVRMDADGKHIMPHLAHAWEIEESRTVWTFYLRKGILFHHGRIMTSADVGYSLLRLQHLAPRALFSWAYANIVEIETPDDTTIHIRLKQRNESFLAFLTTNRASIVPQDACETAGIHFGQLPVGTGPFHLAGQEQGIWRLEAFTSYFQGRAFLDRVELWNMPEKAESILPEGAKQFLIIHNARKSDLVDEQSQQIRPSGVIYKFMTVNTLKKGPIASADMRRALDMALDRAAIVGKINGDGIETGDSFMSSSIYPKLHDTQDTCEMNRLLAASGYEGQTLTLITIPQYEFDARLIREVCADVGIPINIQLLPAEEFKGEARMTADLLLFAVMLDEHRELRLIDLYMSMRQHAAPDIQSIIDKTIQLLQEEPDANRRLSLFAKLEAELISKHYLFFLYRKQLRTAFHPSVKGIPLESLGWVRFRDIWFK